MAVEETDLERRVLAHERILQALIIHLIETRPELLDDLCARFSTPGRGGYQHAHTDTSGYAEQFMQDIRRSARPGPRAPLRPDSHVPAIAALPGGAPNDKVATIRARLRAGVWRVTCDQVFHGDYTRVGPAIEAAITAARAIQRNGGAAQVLFDQQGRCP